QINPIVEPVLHRGELVDRVSDKLDVGAFPAGASDLSGRVRRRDGLRKLGATRGDVEGQADVVDLRHHVRHRVVHRLALIRHPDVQVSGDVLDDAPPEVRGQLGPVDVDRLVVRVVVLTPDDPGAHGDVVPEHVDAGGAVVGGFAEQLALDPGVR